MYKLFTAAVLCLCIVVALEGTVAAESPAADKAEKMVGPNEGDFLTYQFVRYVFDESEGFMLPNSSTLQKEKGLSVEKSNLQRGDVVFFQGTSLMSGIYIGDNKFVVVTSSGISERDFNSEYWSSRYVEARRYQPEESFQDSRADMAFESIGPNQNELLTYEFVSHIYSKAGDVEVPASASGQREMGEPVESGDLQAGDIVFFQGNTLMSGIYLSGNRFVIVTSSGISERRLTNDYWSERFDGGVRIKEQESLDIEEVGQKALSLKGSPYKLNGESPDEGFSTGTFVHYVFKEVHGSILSKIPSRQMEAGTKINKEDLKSGDLVFFQGSSSIISGIYISNGRFIIATSDGVLERNMRSSSYYSERYVGAVHYNEEDLRIAHPNTYKDHSHPAVKEAMKYLYTPYLLGGNDLNAFDCAYLTQIAFDEGMNITIPRSTQNQWEVGELLLESEEDFKWSEIDSHIRPGDVLYFSGTIREGLSHTGIYVGNNYIVHASGSEGETTISYLSSYWQNKFTGVKRFDDLNIGADNSLVQKAEKLLGTPHSMGGTNPDTGFDTGGFIQYLFAEAENKAIPRYGSQMWNEGEETALEDVKPGDIVFFQAGSIIPSLYIGNGQVMLVSNSDGVSVINMYANTYWTPLLKGARTL